MELNKFRKTQRLGFTSTILFDVIVLLNICLSVYLLFFNPYRTISQGIWFFFAVQASTLPVLIIITQINSRKEIIRYKRILEDSNAIKRKTALFSELDGKIIDPFQAKYSGIINFLNIVIILTFVFDFIITFNFVWVGAFVDSLPASRGQTIGEIYYYVAILNQAYFLSIIFFSFLIISILQPKDDLQKLIYNSGEELDFSVRKSSFTKFKELKSIKKRSLLTLIILLLLTLSGIGIAFYSLDDQISIESIPSKTNLVNYEAYHLRVNSLDKIQYIVLADLVNEYGRPFPQLTLVEFDPESGQIFDVKLQDMPYGREFIIDSTYSGKDAYFLTFTDVPGNLGYNYTIYHVDMDTKQSSLIYFNYLNVQFHEFNEYWGRLNYNLVAFENGVHLFQTDLLVVAETTVTNVTSIDLNGNIRIQPIQGITVLDGLSFQGRTYLLHHDPSSNFAYFALSQIDATGLEMNTSQFSTTTTLQTYNEEQTQGFYPNGVGLILVDNELFYRSQNNFYSITRDISAKRVLLYDNLIRGFYSKTFRGIAKIDNHLIIPSERGVSYYKYENLEFILEGKAQQSGFISSTYGNLVNYEDKIFSPNYDGRLFKWTGNPSDIKAHHKWISNLIFSSISLYSVLSIVFIFLKNKWIEE